MSKCCMSGFPHGSLWHCLTKHIFGRHLFAGDLQGVEGEVQDVRDDGKVMVLPKIDGFNEKVDFDPEELRKKFEVSLCPQLPWPMCTSCPLPY